MVWIFLLLAIAIVYLAVTRRLEGLDVRLEMYWQKLKMAIQYFKEDVRDVEAEIQARAARQRGEEDAKSEPGVRSKSAAENPAP